MEKEGSLSEPSASPKGAASVTDAGGGVAERRVLSPRHPLTQATGLLWGLHKLLFKNLEATQAGCSWGLPLGLGQWLMSLSHHRAKSLPLSGA